MQYILKDEWLAPGATAPEPDEGSGAAAQAATAEPQAEGDAAGPQGAPLGGGGLVEAVAEYVGDELDPRAGLAEAAEGQGWEREERAASDNMPLRVQARAALAGAGAGVNLTETRELARTLNLPEGVLARQPEYMRREMLATRLAGNPGLSRWARISAANAALARDNVLECGMAARGFEPLGRAWKGWEETERELGKYPKDIKAVSDPFRNFYNGWLDLARGVLAASKSTQDLAFGRESASSRWFQKWINTVNAMEADTDEPASFGGRLARDVVRNIPQLGAQVATWLTAGPAAATGLMFSYIYGGDYAKLTAKGISPENAAFAGAVDAALQSVLERVGIGSMLRGFGARGWKGVLEAAGRAAATEGATEAAQHMPEYLTEWWAQSSLYADDLESRAKWTWDKASEAANLMQGTKDALYEGLVGAILGAPVGGIHSYLNSDRPENPVKELARAMGRYGRQALARLELDRAMESVKALTAKNRNDPDAAREMLNASLPENMRQAWIGAEDAASLLAEYGHGPQEIVEILGGDIGLINDSIAAGLPLQADMARALASGMAEKFRPVLRMEADGPTLEEALAWSPEKAMDDMTRILNQEDDLEDFSGGDREQQLALGARDLHARQMRIRPHINRLLKQMKAAGFTDIEAKANAELIESHALAMWSRYGADPAAALARWNIARGEQGNDKILGQAVLSGEGRLIRIFKNRNVSTLPHESSHVFVDDLLGIVTDNGKTAVELLDREFAALARDDADFASEMKPRLEAALQGDRAENLRGLARELAAEARELDARLRDLEQKSGNAGPDGQPEAGHDADYSGQAANGREQEDAAQIRQTALARKNLARMSRRAARHIDGLERAREDARILGLYAGLDENEVNDVINLSGDPEMGMASYEALQEAAAKGFASYLKAGRAPNSRLAMVFRRMRQWLTTLMSQSQTLWPGVDPAVAGVYDRLLAADRDIELYASVASANSTEADFTTSPRLEQEDKKELLLLLEKVRAASADKALGAMRRKRKKLYRARYKSIREELGREPFWQLAEKGSFQRAEVETILGGPAADALGLLRRDFYREDAQAADITAADAGFDSAAQMLQSLHERLVENNETRDNLAQGMALAELEAREREDEEKALALDADAYGKYLDCADRAIARAIGHMRMKTREEAERWAQNSMMPRQFVTSQAANLLSERPLRQITPASLRALLNRALKKRNDFLDSDRPADMMRALNALKDARVAAEMLNLYQGYRNRAEKIRKKAQKLARPKAGTMGAAQLEALRKLLAAYNLGALRAPEDLAYSRQDFASLVREIARDNESVGVIPSFPDWLLRLAHPATGISPQGRDFVRFHDLSPNQMADLENLMDFLAHTGREQTLEDKNSYKMKVAAIAIRAAAKMRKLAPAKKGGGARHYFRWLSASVDQLLWQARKADGLENVTGNGRPGEMEELVRQIYVADERVRGWSDKINRQMEPHFEHLRAARARLEAAYGRQMRIRRGDGSIIQPPKIWRDAHSQDYYSFETLLAIALNCGNESNLIRIIGGYLPKKGQNPGDAMSFDDLGYIIGDELAARMARAMKHPYEPTGKTGIFSLDDWSAIQGIWDSLALLWPDTVRVHKEIFGFAPKPVPPWPFMLKRQGETRDFGGGYYPVAYDRDIDEKVGAWSEAEDLLARNEARFSPPRAKDSHTKDRAKSLPGLPLLLDPGIIARHVSEAAKFVEYGPVVRFFDHISQDPEFRAAYRETFGREDYDAIRNNLRGLVRQEEPGDAVAAIERKIRKYLVPWGLAWNPNAAIMQMTAIFPAMGDIGARPVLKSLAYMATHGIEAARQIWSASPYMLSRMENIDQDLARNVGQFSLERKKTFTIGKKSFTWDAIVDAGMKMLVGMDAAATCAVWLAAYKTRLEALRENPGLSANAAVSGRNGGNPHQGGGKAAPDESPDNSGQTGRQYAGAEATDWQGSRQNSAPAEKAGDRGINSFQLNAKDGAEKAQGQRPGFTLNRRHGMEQQAGPNEGPGGPESAINSGGEGKQRNGDTGNTPDSAEPERARHWLDRINPLTLAAPITDSLYSRGRDGSIIEFEDKCHQEAARYADMIVKQSNPDFDPSSRSAFLRGNGMARILNQFSSALTLFASRDRFLGVARDKGKISRAEYGKHQFYTYVLPALALYMFFWLLRDHDAKKASAVKSLAGYSIDQFSMKLPVFGSAAGAAMEQFAGLGTGRGGGLRTSLDAPFALGMGAARAAGSPLLQKQTDEQKKAAIYAIADIISFVARVPVSRIARKAERGWEQRKRGEGNLANVVFPKAGR